ncbi:HYR domain-containing protein, partial [Aestuariivivens sediminicola]|uniref:HYR domain-containing protein n=1 Tax=Aestuariivivens sediminicola TaxID=2913560 RepID=UPI001F589E71
MNKSYLCKLLYTYSALLLCSSLWANSIFINREIASTEKNNSPYYGILSDYVNFYNPDSFNKGYTAIEVESNSSSSFAPNLLCPSDITNQTNDINTCGALINSSDITPTYDPSVTSLTWEMSGAIIDSNNNAGINIIPDYTFPVGITTITYTANDGLGQLDSEEQCSFTIEVVDNQAPVITHNGDQNLNTDTDACNAAFSASASASDNCSVGSPS